MSSALGVLAGPEAEVETQLDQVVNVAGLWVGGGGYHGHNGLDDAKGGGFFTLDEEIFGSISFEFPDKAPVQFGVILGVGGGSGVWEAIQEVGCCNRLHT